ncbi:MAG: hypothetical protein NZ957_05720 [Thaumarchaeota archaeon]|nr:hypothetical protein [Candidatus Calditenuaceae archaeon]
MSEYDKYLHLPIDQCPICNALGRPATEEEVFHIIHHLTKEQYLKKVGDNYALTQKGRRRVLSILSNAKREP